MRTLLSIILLVAAAFPAAAANDFLPETQYDPQAPSFEQVLGHAAGERISRPEQIRAWFDALAEAYPDRIRLVPYATSWEGRELFYAVVGAPERIADLDSIRDDIQTIAHPHRNDRAAVNRALERVPGTLWLAASVHGNEISPADAAMVTAWHLLAARGDEVVDAILANTLVFINPLQNPDGRARFIHGFEMAQGLEPQSSRLAAERDEPWPSGRVNHYLFDLNRDWLTITQPETKGHVAALLEWYPLAFVDAHEMGSDSTFFFAPEAIPYNPLLADTQRASLDLFGRNNASWFDRFGFDYFTRDIFDAFYPGYGASWPSYYGGIAMTYEQASARGLKARRRDGSEFNYRETVREYFVAMLATAQTVSNHRERLWRDFRDWRAAGPELAASEGPRGWVIPAQRDQGGADRLGGLLARHGIEVYRNESSLRACGRELAGGSYLIPGAQPEYRKLRVLLDENIEMEADFVAEQERRRAKGLGDEIYDVTAWALPAMFNIETLACSDSLPVNGLAQVESGEPMPGQVENAEASVAWIVPGGSRATAQLMAAALRKGLHVRISERAFTVTGREFPSGSLIIPAAGNPDDVAEVLTRIAWDSGASVVGMDTSWVTEGPSFGSRFVHNLVAPRVAMAWDAPTSVNSPGSLRFVLERQFGYPVTPIRTHTLARADLTRFDVIILSDETGRYGGGYRQFLGEAGAGNLTRWVEAGGVLVTVAGGTEWAAHPDVDLLAIRAEYEAEPEDAESGGNDDEDSARVPGRVIESEDEYRKLLRPEDKQLDSVAGVLARAVLDPDHWLSAGVADEVNVLVRGRRSFTPLSLDEGSNVARFAAADALPAGGYLWEENRLQLAFKPFVVVQNRQRGMVIGFTEGPAVRAYLDGLNQLLVNAVLVAPARSGKLR